ncbi:MAG: hypothetical protein JSV04_09445 [Candidatus Heimdallarchaeota archaeon]|nr:MAG: hypothetical protein JSV04_09445 [Candidatus Heimdallarchaeota archaeon]
MGEFTQTVEWLLEDSYPLTKYNTLVHILDTDSSDSEVQESLQGMLTSNPIRAIFNHQNKDGGFFQEKWVETYNPYWVNARYLPKYKATTWQARFLCEAGVPKTDPRIQKLGNYILETMYTPEQGFYKDKLACVNADIVWALLSWGFGNDSRVKKAFDIQARYQRFDDGDWQPPEEWPYKGLKGHCYGPNSCIVGIMQFLRTLTVVPDSYLTTELEDLKRKILGFYQKHGVLERNIVKKYSKSLGSYRNHRVHPNNELTSPFFGRNDVVEVITNLLKLGMKTESLHDGIDFVLSKQTENQRWILENTKSGMYSSWGKKGKENKWVTFRVLFMLKLVGIDFP